MYHLLFVNSTFDWLSMWSIANQKLAFICINTCIGMYILQFIYLFIAMMRAFNFKDFVRFFTIIAWIFFNLDYVVFYYTCLNNFVIVQVMLLKYLKLVNYKINLQFFYISSVNISESKGKNIVRFMLCSQAFGSTHNQLCIWLYTPDKCLSDSCGRCMCNRCSMDVIIAQVS